MRAFNERMIYGCKDGVLWQDDDGYIWRPKEGKTLYEDRGDIKVNSIDTSDLYAYISGTRPIGIKVIEIGDTKLIGDMDTREWDEVTCKKIEGTDSILYVTKNNVDLSIIVDKSGRCRHLVETMSAMANLALFGTCDYYDKYITEDIRNMKWIVGKANWQGKAVNKNQELKLRMVGSWGEDSFKDYEAVRLDNIGIEVYWDTYIDFDNEARNYYWPHWCDNKHRFYKV